MPATPGTRTRWWMMALMVLTGTFVAAMPMSCMPVLFKEIADDLGLSLVQVGSVWGIASLAGIFVSLLAGVLADRFGTRRIIVVFCLLTGLTGALRGVAGSFGVLLAIVFLNGAVRLIVPVAVTKNIGLWFRGGRLGMAMGLGAMGMGLGLMLGPLLSASVLSPWLGGWRPVMYFLGGLSALVGLVWWLLARDAPGQPSGPVAGGVPFRRAIGELVRIRGVWVIGLALLFRVGSLMGMTGYVPLYLRDFLNWAPTPADSTLSAFYAISTVCVVPLAYLSDRLGSRRAVMLPALAVGFIALVLLPTADGAVVWVLMIASGMFMDSFMSLTTTLIAEVRGIRPEYFGTALGFVFTMGQIGAVAAPPLGNMLADISGGAPFYFWAASGLVSLIILAVFPVARSTDHEPVPAAEAVV
jgi:MFS family permease